MSPAFDPREVEREPAIEVVDEGQYLVEIHKCADKLDDFGHKVRVFYKVLSDGSGKGKMLMENFNIGHGNPDAERIGKQQFAKLLDVLNRGKELLHSFSDLEGDKLKIDVDIVPHYKDPSQTQNKIKKHMPAVHVDNKVQMTHSNQDDLPF
jgi:hypothetical protein